MFLSVVILGRFTTRDSRGGPVHQHRRAATTCTTPRDATLRAQQKPQQTTRQLQSV